LYNFYGIFSKSGDQSNNNAYYSSVGSGNWATQQANALDQGTGSHMAFIQTEDENNFIFQACTFIDAHIWIGGTDGEDTEAGEGTWVWKDNSETVFGTGAGEDFINADGFESFWNSGEPNDAGEGEDYAQYYYNRKKWNDLSGTQSMKTIIEIESEELNKFTLPLTDLQEGLVTITLKNVTDKAGNEIPEDVYYSFTYDTTSPGYDGVGCGVYDDNLVDYVVSAHTRDLTPQ
ncbi:uncharacterized protein METZ01_LOCUS508609, partial [marine metagenome]